MNKTMQEALVRVVLQEEVMGFRQNNRNRSDWRDWMEKNRDYLIRECGLPLSVLQSKWSWDYFLDHQYFSSSAGYTDVDVNELEETHARNLCEFLEREVNDKESCSTLNRLQFRFKRGKYVEQEHPPDEPET